MSDSHETRCPHCGRALPDKAVACAHCEQQATTAAALDAYRTPAPINDATSAATFSLATLLALVTIIAVSLGLGLWQPALGIGVFVLCTPAYIRAGLILRRLRQAGVGLRFSADHLAFFLGSLGLFLASYLAAGVAFYAMCWAGFIGGSVISQVIGGKGYDPIGYGLMAGVIIGGICGVAALIWIAMKWWPVSKRVKSILAQRNLPDTSARETTSSE